MSGLRLTNSGLAWLLAALVVATAALTPLLGVPVYGRNFGHDANFALTALHWMDSGIAAGRWWPRWVPETHWGLGGYTFYTYPPLAYWAAALLKRLSGLSVADTLALAVMLWRLGFLLGCYLWLRRHVAPAVALAAAALAALLPYAAVINPWMRFAHAEIAGSAMLPFLLIAIERAAEHRDGRGLPGLALSFAALALTHLPTTALVAHVAPLYAWAYAGPRAALRTVLGGAAGAGLAACYVLPAAGLLRQANFEGLDDGTWERSLLGWSALRGTATWVQFILTVWVASALAVTAAVFFRWQAPAASPLRRGSMLLLLAAAALMTVVSLPLWVLLPQLRSIEFPWRAAGLLTPALAGLAALALAAGGAWARRGVLALGLLGAALPPLYLLAVTQFGNPGWPRFLPAEERLARALSSPRGASPEHLPATAVAAGWRSLFDGTETSTGAEPYPRPALPPGTTRLPAGFLVPEATATFALPQFHFPGWQARDAAGQMLPVRARADGFLEVVVDHPARGIRIEAGVTPWEWAGWAVTGLSAAGLLGLGLWWRPRRAVAAAMHGAG
jgi:hypothetical protein